MKSNESEIHRVSLFACYIFLYLFLANKNRHDYFDHDGFLLGLNIAE